MVCQKLKRDIKRSSSLERIREIRNPCIQWQRESHLTLFWKERGPQEYSRSYLFPIDILISKLVVDDIRLHTQLLYPIEKKFKNY